MVGAVSPGKGGALEQVEGEDAADEVADDAELAQKEEAGLPGHVDEGRAAVNGVDRRRRRSDEADDDIGGEQRDAGPGARLRLRRVRLHGRDQADEVEAPDERQAKRRNSPAGKPSRWAPLASQEVLVQAFKIASPSSLDG